MLLSSDRGHDEDVVRCFAVKNREIREDRNTGRSRYLRQGILTPENTKLTGNYTVSLSAC
jgi:hypothetical protein